MIQRDQERARKGPGRNGTTRAALYASECTGLRCHFFSHLRRSHIPNLLEGTAHCGDSAEIGVWMGRFSEALLLGWKHGGRHLMVDPYEAFKCQAQDRIGDKQCHFNQSYFDELYVQTRRRMRSFAGRARFARNFSVAASTAVPAKSLSVVYIDARHDYEGVLEDLRAWWPKLRDGGVFFGHDWTYGIARGKSRNVPVADALRSFLLDTLPPPRDVFITAENPASWILLSPIEGCDAVRVNVD